MISRLVTMAMLAAVFLWSETAVAERTVVLVANTRCPVEDLSNLEIRKAYFGLSVRVGEQNIRPLRLVADQVLNRVFFQTIVAMSEKSYERRALSLALKFGTPRPAEFKDVAEALSALQRSDCAILFLWAENQPDASVAKKIKVLWQGS